MLLVFFCSAYPDLRLDFPYTLKMAVYVKTGSKDPWPFIEATGFCLAFHIYTRACRESISGTAVWAKEYILAYKFKFRLKVNLTVRSLLWERNLLVDLLNQNPILQ